MRITNSTLLNNAFCIIHGPWTIFIGHAKDIHRYIQNTLNLFETNYCYSIIYYQTVAYLKNATPHYYTSRNIEGMGMGKLNKESDVCRMAYIVRSIEQLVLLRIFIDKNRYP